MSAPIVHLLSSAVWGAFALVDAQSASIEKSGSPQEYVQADNPDVALVAVDRIASTVTVNTLGYIEDSDIDVGDVVGVTGLALTIKPRAEGKGVTAPPVVITYLKAVCISKSAGPVIEGNPTYSVTFRCHKVAA